jgi:2-polyprenyl-3-methyl-5-hydroxy-6-metoxy-1,4-benzoquinol methylase
MEPASVTERSHPLGIDSENVNAASRNEEFYNRMAYEYDRSYHSASKYQDLSTQIETKFIMSNMVVDGRTLEVGPGQGRFTERLAEKSETVVAADVSLKMLDICQARTKSQNVVYHHSDLFQLDEKKVGGPFDTIVAMWVIPHLEDGTIAIRKLLSLLKPEGRMIFDLWNSASLRKRQITRFNERKRQEESHWIHERGWVYTRYYTYEEMLILLRRVGLTSIEEQGRCLVPMMGYPGSRLLFPLYKRVDELLQTRCKKYYYSRLFCCRPS